jgi:hypothetical protein
MDFRLQIDWRTIFDEKIAKCVRISASRPANPFDTPPQSVLQKLNIWFVAQSFRYRFVGLQL